MITGMFSSQSQVSNNNSYTMKSSVAVVLLFLVLVACKAENQECHDDSFVAEVVQKDDYDSTYAASIGADEYGMHSYVMAILKSGPNTPPTAEIRDSLFRGHMDNIQRMAEEGTLVLAGPFMDDSEYRGIYIFDVSSVDEAIKLTETDPAIQYGSLIMELKPWYGSATLKEINSLHKRAAKAKV